MGKTRDDIDGKTTLTAVKTDSDIADAITKKHANTLDHNGSTQDTAIAGKEPANANIQAHVTSAHAPSNAQKNSDITKVEIEAKLIGELTSHTHAGGSGDMTKAVYDPNADGVIAKAQLDPALANTSGTNTGDQTLTGLGGIAHSLATAVNDFLVASGVGAFAKKTLAETKAILDWAADIATHAGLTTGVHGAGASTVETVAGSQAKVDARLSAANATDLTDGGATTLHTHAGGGGISTLKKTSDQIINGTAFQNITDLVFNVLANTDYAFKFYIVFRSAATTTGFRFGVLAPTGAVLDFFTTYQTIANATTAGVATWLQGHWVNGEAMAATTATITAAVDLVCMIEGRVKVGATAGTLAARVASELADNNLVVQKGSWGWWF